MKIMIKEWFINKRKYGNILSQANNLNPRLDCITSYITDHRFPKAGKGGFGGRVLLCAPIGKISIPMHLVVEYLKQSQDSLDLDLVLYDGHSMVQEISNSVSDSDMSSLFRTSNIFETLAKLSRVIDFQKRIFEVLDSKEVDPQVKELYKTKLSNDMNVNFNLEYIESLESELNYILSHDQYFESRLSLVIKNESTTTFNAIYEKDSNSYTLDLNESRFHFLWYLCYLRIEDKGYGLLRGGGIPAELYQKFSANLKSSLARAWNNFSNEISTSSAAEQAKYKSNINSVLPNIIELSSNHYCLNRKISKKNLNIPHL